MPYQIFNGVYDSFAEAGKDSGLFQSGIYLDKARERLRAALDGISPVHDYIIIPFSAGLLAARGKLSILDFGGGPGITYLELKHALASMHGLTYHSLDHEDVCAIGHETLGEEAAAIFRCNMNELDARYDLVHFGSVLQYIDDLPGLLSTIKEKEPSHILVSDAMAGSGRSFVTMQDYYGQKHPFRFYSREDFLSAFAAIGFELMLEMPFVPKIQGQLKFYDMSNLPADCRMDHPCHLVFRSRKGI